MNHVTSHAPGSKLSRLAKARTAPAAPKPKTPGRPVAPVPPSRLQRVSSAPTPNRDIAGVRPLNNKQLSNLAALGAHTQRANAMPSRDAEIEFDEHAESPALVDVSKLNPGPDAADVPFGFNCGSCSKFLALNDPRRDDPEFMEGYLSSSQHCPAAVIELVRAKNKTPDEIVRRANDTACNKFKIATKRATSEFIELLSTVRSVTKGEFDVLTSQLDTIQREKALEEKYGYKLGDSVKTHVPGVDGVVNARVIGFKGKNVVLVATIGQKRVTLRQPIPEARVILD